MKNYLLLLSLAVMILASCKDDEPEIDPIVGVWEMQELTISGNDANFSSYHGTGSSLYGESSYVFEFFADNTYERRLDEIPGYGNADDEGEWEVEDNELDLDVDRRDLNLPTSFEIEELDGETMILIFVEEDFEAFPNNIRSDPQALDTIETQEEYNQIFAEYGQYIDLTITLEFEKDN